MSEISSRDSAPPDTPKDKKTILQSWLVYFSLSCLVSIGLVAGLYFLAANQDRSRLMVKERVGVELKKEMLATEAKWIISALLYVNKARELRQFIESRDEGDRLALESELLTFSRYQKVFDQIRFLDETGMEVVRINYSRGTPRAVEKGDLQFKGDRYYFRETVKLPRDGVYISPFDLNVENGEIEIPIKPIIRFCTPVTDRTGKTIGIVVLNYSGEVMLERMALEISDSAYPSWLINAQGFWLYSQYPERNWGFMYADKKALTFQHEFPVEWQRMVTEGQGQLSTGRGLLTFTTVYPLEECIREFNLAGPKPAGFSVSPSRDNYHWYIVSHIPPSDLSRQTAEMRWMALFLSGGLICTVAFHIRHKKLQRQDGLLCGNLPRYIRGQKKPGSARIPGQP